MSQAPEGIPEAHTGTGIGDDYGNDNGPGTGHGKETTITAVTITSEADCMLKGCVNGVPASILVDTGAAATILAKELWDRTGSKTPLTSSDRQKLVSVQGIPLHLHGGAQLELQLKDELFSIRVIVVDTLTPGVDVILGRDFLRDHRCTIEMGETRDTLHFKDRSISFILDGQEQSPQHTKVHVVLDKHLHVPPYSEIEVMARVPPSAVSRTWIVEGDVEQRNALLVARAIVTPVGTEIPLRLLNWRNEAVSIPSRTAVAQMELVADADIAAETVAAIQANSREVPEEHRRRLWAMASKSGDRLTQAEQEQLFALCLEYEDLFARGADDFGRTGKLAHKIDTEGSPPIRQQARRIPPFRKEEVKKLLDKMLKRDVIKPSKSPWASPVVLVKKKDGSTRFCIDYRRVNAVTRKDAYPLPRIDATLDTLAGSKWFSTLDLISGYWQVEVDPEDQDKTAFCTPNGLFEFKVMPFGLCNAPATFQRLMDMVLAGVQWSSCLVYLDDVIIVGKTFKEHLKNLREVFNRLRSAGLKLKPSKCDFCCKQVEFLGHSVSEDGVRTDPTKTEKVAQWPVPKTKREVQQFLGLANYYRRFVKDFAAVAKPLHRLTEKNCKFTWANDCQTAFEELRHRLVTSPILAFPDYTREFTLDTDASDTGIGAVLSQVQPDGTERVVAYASRTLTKPERRYCVTRRELLAVVTFIHHFRQYLLGRRFSLRTDHGSLTWLSNFKEPEGQLARWLERLQKYDFSITHRPGRKHQNADSLSRHPCTQCGRASHIEEPTPDVIAVEQHVTPALVQKSSDQLRRLQLDDGPVGLLLRAVEKTEKPASEDARGQGPEAQRLTQLWSRLVMDDGILKRRYEDTQSQSTWLQLVVPRSLRDEVLHELHAGALEGHLGEDKTLNKLKERFYWPGMQRDVRNWCRTCEVCQTRKSAPKKNHAPLQTIKAGYPMQVVAVDIMGPLPESEAGNSYVLVAGDYFTKWAEVYAIPNQEATTIAQKLTDEMFCRFSPPEQLHSDQGRQFESHVIHEICKLLNIKKTRTTPYHPQCDGQVERFNRTLLDMLATTTREHAFDWENQIRKVCMAYNTSVHSSTGFTPFFLMFGRQAKLPIDLMYGSPRNVTDTPPISDYALHLKNSLEDAYSLAREKLGASHKRRKEQYDRRVHGNPFKPADLVWLHSTVIPQGHSRKLHHPWTGPYTVIERVSESDYRIKGLRGRRRTHIVHFDRLKLCAPGTRFLTAVDGDSAAGHPHTPTPTNLSTPDVFGEDMQLITTETEQPQPPAPRRYPQRDRRPPVRFDPGVPH